MSRAGSMYAAPMTMKSASGTSFPIVSALTTHALWRIPRTLIHAIAEVIAVSAR